MHSARQKKVVREVPLQPHPNKQLRSLQRAVTHHRATDKKLAIEVPQIELGKEKSGSDPKCRGDGAGVGCNDEST
jgi:hypothetical protein